MRYLYSALLYVLLPFALLRLLLRSRRAPAYRQRMAERFGVFTAGFDPASPAIWVHAVSVGEVQGAAPLIEQLLATYPDTPLVVTTTTPTGSERVQALFGDRVCHVYAPWDLPGAVSRFLRRTRPRLLLIMETELWPNLLHCSRAAGCRIILANARLSQRSARGYARFGRFTRELLQQLDAVACQAAADSERFLSLGLPPSALVVTGNIKFDLVLDDPVRARAASLRHIYEALQRPIIVAASTHPGEEQIILDAFGTLRQSVDNCLLLLVPRHPERFAEVCAMATSAGWRVLRRSAGTNPGQRDDIVVGDTMGELLLLLSVAHVAVVGGSLVRRGGHNVLEAAAWGVPVVTGPHIFNFAGISALLVDAGAMIQLEAPQQLAGCLLELLQNPAQREAMGRAGQQVLAANRGALGSILRIVAAQLAEA